MLRVQAAVPLPLPLLVVSVVQLFRFAAVHAADPALSPVRVTAALSLGAAVPTCVATFRELGVTASASATGAAVMRRVSMMRCGASPATVTVMVSTYVPAVRPAVLRVHDVVPLPVPLLAVSVVQLCRFAAVHAVVPALSPVSVTLALSPGAAVPTCALALRESGLTASASGTGAAVMRSVSMTLCGARPATVTVMVSTYVPAVRPAVLRVQAAVPLPVPLLVVSVVQLFRLAAVHAVVPALSPVSVTVALSPDAAVPTCAAVFRESGATASASGSGAAVMRKVSMTLCGARPATVTVMVST